MIQYKKNVPDNLIYWSSYKYVGPGRDLLHPVNYERSNGPEDKPYVWVDDSKWSIDTPESPNSILPLMYYQKWGGESVCDLRNSNIQFFLRGDGLDLKEGQCFFWIVTETPFSTRWHYSSHPIKVSENYWDEPTILELSDDPKHWHMSFSCEPQKPASLNHSLAACSSFGFSFIGFSEKVTGKLSISSFKLKQNKKNNNWPFAADFIKSAGYWHSISRQQKKQIELPVGIMTYDLMDGSIPEFDCLKQKELLFIKNDFINIPNNQPFCYLAFIHSANSILGHDLRNAILTVSQYCHKFDSKGGNIVFFIEHSYSDTIWIYREPLGEESITILHEEESCWHRVMGTVALESVISGNNGDMGYDYLGLMIVDAADHPTGDWGVFHFSIGPTINSYKYNRLGC